jgi:tetratricopeptide (TPR) repeat protein
LGSRHWVDFSLNPEQGIARLRKQLKWLDTPEGILATLKDRLTDAERDLKRAKLEDEVRVQTEITDLKDAIKQQELIVKNPDAAAKQTRKSIDAGLERERKPVESVSGTVTTKYINHPPVTAPDYFQGRATETQEIVEFLRNDFQRVMTIVGRAGGGKSALVCRVLKAIEAGKLPDNLGEMKVGGIVYLSEITNHKVNVENVFSNLLRLLTLDVAEKLERLYREPKVSTADKIRALLDAFQQDMAILLLDNFETLLDPDTQSILDAELKAALETIVCAPPHKIKVIITTRVPLHEMALCEPSRQYNKHLEEGLKSPYAENILRAMDKDGRAGLRDASDELLRRARELTLGYPRALESLYAIITVDRYTSLEELLNYDLPGTVVEKLVGEAFNRLDSAGKMVMQVLAIYNRPVTPSAIDYLLQFHLPGINSAPVLNRLVNMHFARRETGRYYLHPIDREYAISRIPVGQPGKEMGKGARARIWDTHALTLRAADYFAEARKPRAEWKKLDDLAAQLAEFDLRCAAGDYDTACSVLREFDFNYLLLWGHYRLTIQMHEKVTEKINDSLLCMGNLNSLGLAYQQLGDARKSILYFEQGIPAAKDAKNRQAEGAFLGNLGAAYADLGDARKAIEFYEQQLVIVREIGDRRGEGNALGNLGNAYADLGDARKAIEYYEQALVIAREIGDRRGEGNAFGNLGNAYADLGDARKAIEFYEQALVINREIGDRRGEGNALGNLGSAYANLGDARKAIEFYEQALVIAREIGDKRNEGNWLGNLGSAYADLGEARKAIELYEKQLVIVREIGDQRGESINLENTGQILLSIGEHKKSEEKFKQAIQISDNISFPIEQINARKSLAETYFLQNDLVNARATIEAALQYDVPKYNHNASALHGIIALRQGDASAARQAFTRAIAQAEKILAKTPDFYEALDAKGLSICGLTICTQDDGRRTTDDRKTVAEAVEVFRKARKIAPHAGVVKSVLRLFDELVKCDSDGVLKDVRKSAEGVE